MQYLGELGENFFGAWCADAGLVANKSSNDKTGWDFTVEFPLDKINDSHEIHKSTIECRVQVKSTNNKRGSVSITLSNLRRLVTAPVPCFIFLLQFDGESTVQRCYAVHVDKNLITKVLKRIHEIEQKESKKRYNKRTMSIRFEKKDLMRCLNGKGLKEILLKHIGPDLDQYVSLKKKHLRTTGFENGGMNFSFSLIGEENLKKFIDVSVGLEKEVEVSNYMNVRTRFGIPENKSLIEVDEVRLFMPEIKPDNQGVIRFRENELSAGITLGVVVYNSPFNKLVCKEFRRTRIKSDFLEILLNPYTGDAQHSTSVDVEKRFKISEIRDFLELASWLRVPNKKIHLELLLNNATKLEIPITIKDINHESPGTFEQERSVLEAVTVILRYFDSEHIVEASLKDIFIYEKQIETFRNIISSKPQAYKAEFFLDEQLEKEKEVAFAMLVSIPIGSHIFGLVLVLIGEASLDEEIGKYVLTTTNAVIEKKMIFEIEKIPSQRVLDGLIDEVEKIYGAKYSVVTAGLKLS